VGKRAYIYSILSNLLLLSILLRFNSLSNRKEGKGKGKLLTSLYTKCQQRLSVPVVGWWQACVLSHTFTQHYGHFPVIPTISTGGIEITPGTTAFGLNLDIFSIGNSAINDSDIDNTGALSKPVMLLILNDFSDISANSVALCNAGNLLSISEIGGSSAKTVWRCDDTPHCPISLCTQNFSVNHLSA